jgi:large subunit ribosomal protein L24
MVKNSFSSAWKSSTQVRKQRKYRYNAPLHIKQKLVHVHLSKPLREKYAIRNVQVKKGDKVKVLRGQFNKKEGKVERVDLKKEKVYVTGIEIIKKDGSKLVQSLHPSNLILVDLNLDDKKRKQKLENKISDEKKLKSETKKENKKEIKNEK